MVRLIDKMKGKNFRPFFKEEIFVEKFAFVFVNLIK